MAESTQHILDRVRSPRVQITYDVEIGDAIVMKELPFIIGVMADLSGMPVNPLPPIKLRKFVEVDGDNFPEFMTSINSRLIFQVKNTLGDGADGLSVELFFKCIDDFAPISIAQQVPKLNKIYNSRIRLNDLVVKLEGNDVLQARIKEVVENADLKAALKQQIDVLLKANKQTITADFATTLGSGTKDAATATPPAADTPANGAPAPADAAKATREILKELFVDGKLARDPMAEIYACNILIELLAKIEAEKLTTIKNALTYVERLTADIDAVLSAQISEILHHPAFQTLEGTWRALYYLVMNIDIGPHLKIRVLNATKKELLDDLEHTIEFDQSQIFKKVYEEEYGTFGGHPYSCLVGGYEFTRSAQDLILLEKISNVAAAAHAPFMAAAHAKLFDMDSFAQLTGPRDISKIFESTEMMKWNSFRDSEDSRYVALVMPRVLMRLPYGPDTLPVEGMNYVESVDGSDSSQFCWGNAAFVLAQRIGNAFSLYKWPAAIRGVEGGGLVEQLPAYTFKTTDGDIALKCPTEIAITDRREKELSGMGFLSICHSKGTDFAAFFGGQTTQRTKIYNTDDANANASLSARLPYLLAASRFAHYIKSIMRDKIGSFLTKDNVSFYLNNWIASYVLLNDSASQTLKAKYPLREARIDVFDVPGKPGSYKATIFLRPHFQLEELTASIRLVAMLPPPAAG
ncbi:MAG: type VI secretion system contractile sheath large subunit [Holosporaceae bacterium]|jgi:type VI secretion system protein ImpC|nr:type VI secretion system contractile sheath large subunit [Holosporaceae bacterium]